MLVTKRNNTTEPVNLDKITRRIEVLSSGLKVEPLLVARRVINGLYDGVTTQELDELAVRTAANLVTLHPDYDFLAARIEASILHKNTPSTFGAAMAKLYRHVRHDGKPAPFISDELMAVITANGPRIEAEIEHDRDFTFDIQGISTLIKTYLLRLDKKIIERPQYMWMRVALGIHLHDLEKAFETYHLMSTKKFTHATPTLFNSGTPRPQMSSCFLLHMHDDSIEGIYKTLTDCAKISQLAGGIGLHVHNIRSTGSPVNGTGGVSNGLTPMLRNFDATASYVDQGGGRRKGSFAIYLEPWHADIMEFLDLKRNTGKDEMRARSLFYGLWTPDLFMQRVEADGMWSLMDPAISTGLADCSGEAFNELYQRYEAEGRFVRQIKAQDLWKKLCEVQVETSMPYIMYKDACNSKSNQQNLGTIKSSNLCSEIVEYTSPDEIAVCNLASVSLPAFVTADGYDHEELHRVAKVAVRNLDIVIDRNFYPVPETKTSNSRHRPIGLGVQGLADVFMQRRISWDSAAAKQLNKDIFETLYHAAVEASMELAQSKGAYSTFEGSPASKGLLQPDLWNVDPGDRYDWVDLRSKVKTHGLRNSLLIALMPTASTANILDNTEGFEPIPSNIFKRNVLSGEFVRVNRYLVNDLMKLGLWNEQLKDRIVAAEGSVQELDIPDELKNLYKTVWEISQRHIIDLAADRGAYVCQSQSMNIYLKDASLAKLTSMHFYGWKKGLKTGSYYIRQQAARSAQKVTVEQPTVDTKLADSKAYLLNKKLAVEADFKTLSSEEIIAWAAGTCSTDDPEGCIMCSG